MNISRVPIGGGVQLPDHIKNSKPIHGLTRDKTNGHDFNDNLCLFRCLALHFGALEQPSNRFKERLKSTLEKPLMMESR